ncbi:RNaseH domain-containing protein [Bradyrhizobium sp. USDA 4519]
MKSDNNNETKWRRRRVKQETFISGLSWRGHDGNEAHSVSLKWTKSASGLLSGVLQEGIGSGKDNGKNLPYASLRSVIEARVPGISVVRSDLGKPWTDVEPRPFLRAFGQKEDGSDVVRSVSGAVAQWTSDVLFGWAERLDIGTERIDRIRTLSLEGRIVELSEANLLSIPPGAVNAHENFSDVRDTVISLLVAALDGQELFEGLGPVHRVIASGMNGNAVEFETWPIAAPNGSFSMTCTITVETLPWSLEPYVIVNAGKRIWMDRFPRPGELFGRKRLTIRMMVRGNRRLSIAYEMGVKSGIPDSDGIEDPAFLAAVLQNGVDLGSGLPEVAGRTSLAGNAFLAVPYSTKFGRTKVPRGATAQDQVDLVTRVASLTERFGFAPLPFEPVSGIGDHEEYHKALKSEMLLHHAASDLRLNDISDERVTALFEEIIGEKPDRKIKSDDVIAAGRLIETVRIANDERLSRVFSDRVKVVLISRTSAEADLFTAATRSMFSTVDVERYGLPPKVHGVLEATKDRKRFKQKFEDRVAAWKSLAETIAGAHPRARIIVQVDKEYGDDRAARKREEDAVNKPAGRYALARYAGANVQYLLPMETGGASEYLIRLQAALYDLLFGHSGMAPAVGPAINGAFPEGGARPDSILGFSVIRKARQRRGGSSVALITASLLDAESGAVCAKVATTSGNSSWMEFGDALVHAASLGATGIGEGRADEATLFQDFVSNVVKEVVSDGRRPLVLFDAVSAQGLWPWLNNPKLTGLPTFGREQVPDKAVWEELSVVRVRTKSTPRLLRLMHQENTSIDGKEVIKDCHASTSNVTVRVVDGEDRGDYVTARKWQRTQKVVRGTSAYRSLPGFRRSEKADDGTTLYKRIVHTPETNDAVVPESVGITVVRAAAGAQADSIAAVVASLRSGYAHTAMDTTLPAPLSFRSKFEDYMSRHGLEEDEDVQDEATTASDASASDDGPDASGVVGDVQTPAVRLPTFGEVRDQFRSGNFNSVLKVETKGFSFMDNVKLASTSVGSTSISKRASAAFPSGDFPSEAVSLVSDHRELIKPRLRVPEVASPEWFRSHMNITRRDLRELHDTHGDLLRMVTGFPWPEERPNLDQFFAFLPEAARYPLFFRCFFKTMRLIRDDYLIKPVMQQYWAEKARFKNVPEVENAESGPDALVEMVVAGASHDLAIAVVILDWSASMMFGSSGQRLASLVPEISDYLHDLMQCDPAGYATRIDEMKDEVPERARIPHLQMASSDADAEPAIRGPEEIEIEPPIATASLDDVVNRWENDLLDLIDTAKNALNVGPTAATQQEIAVIASHLRQHLEDFERLKPKGAGSDAVISRLTKIARAFVDISEGYVRDVATRLTEIEAISASAPLLASEESLREADALAEQADVDLLRAQEARKDADELQQKKLPMFELVKLGQAAMNRLETIVNSGLENVSAAINAIKIAASVTSVSSAARSTAEEDPATAPPAVAPPSPGVERTIGAQSENGTRPSVELASSIVIDEDDLAEIDEGRKIEPIHEPPVPVPDDQESETDHLLHDIEKKADELFMHGEFGLGYHLVNAASTVLGDTSALPYSAEEMRLYALGTRIPGVSRVMPDGYHQAIEACVAVAANLGSGERAGARRILLMANVLPTALLQMNEAGNAFNIIDAITTNDWCSSFFYLVDLVKKYRSYSVTAASLRAASSVNADKSLANERRDAVLDQIKSIKHAKFRFVLGQKILRSITAKNGIVSALENAVNQHDLNFVSDFSKKYSDRNAVTNLLDSEVRRMGSMHAIDGAARERLVAYIIDLAAGCGAFIDTAGSADESRVDGKRLDKVRELADNMKTGIRNFEVATAAPTGSLLLDAAYAHARSVFKSLAAVIRGEPTPEVDRKIVNLELHAPLLWLPGMAWSGAWTPSPKDAVRLISAIRELDVPRVSDSLAEAAEVAIEARRKEDAFVPAKMLLSFAPHFGIDAVREEHLRAMIETNELTRKAQVNARHADVSKLIAKVRRMALGGLEASTRLNDDLDEIKVDVLSQDIPDFMPEEIDGFRVLDVNAALSRLNAVEGSARRLLDEAKAALVGEIDRLGETSRITGEEKGRLLKLLNSDELATVTDWIQTFNSGERRPTLTGKVMNEPLDKFNHVLKETSQIDLSEAKRCIEDNVAYGAFDFSHLDGERRQEAAKTLEDWIEFKRKMKNSQVMLSQSMPHIAVLLTSIAYGTEFVDVNGDRSNVGRQIFVVDAQMNLPSDPTSLMLPEFGSLTKGGWRVAAVGPTTTSAEIMALTEGAEPRGTLVLMFGLMSADKRKQLKRDCVKNRRKVLVIDEALLLDYLATPEATPLRMFEIAQAYTTATPYQDYVRSPVPNEMFKGRAREKAKILESYGSYIVYGGRRLGKTALLRHISRNAPEHALFKFLDLNSFPLDLFWQYSSEALKEVFAKPVSAPEDFVAGVKEYLQADNRRRILLLLDEADNFIKHEASQDYRDVVKLLNLMAETDHRFKFVLAGLHNVSRIIKSENSPLAQISNDPIRIGPSVAGGRRRRGNPDARTDVGAWIRI